MLGSDNLGSGVQSINLLFLEFNPHLTLFLLWTTSTLVILVLSDLSVVQQTSHSEKSSDEEDPTFYAISSLSPWKPVIYDCSDGVVRVITDV